MNEGIILYGFRTEAVARALRDLDPRYGAEVPVRCFAAGSEADVARTTEPDTDWLTVELYRPGTDLAGATEVGLWLNTSLVPPGPAARAIDQRDLQAWYEIVKPVRVVTVDGGPARDDYSNLEIVVPEGNRRIVHAVAMGGTWPPCADLNAEMLMPTGDLWALVVSRPPETVLCPDCTARHRR